MNCYNIVSVLCFDFWPPGMWDLSSPGPGFEPTPAALEGKFNHRTPEKSPHATLWKEGGREAAGFCPFKCKGQMHEC